MKNISKNNAVFRTAAFRRMAGIALAAVVLFLTAACDDGSGGSEEPKVDPNIPTVNDFDISGRAQAYDGTSKKVTITPKEGKTEGEITIYYDGSTTPPTNTGVYKVTFEVAANGKFKAVSGLSPGTMSINDAVASSIGELGGRLAGLWPNSASAPYSIALVNTSNISGIGDVLKANSTKYVNFDLSVNGFTAVDLMAFYECTSLTGITLPDSVTGIGSRAFRYCSSLTSVTIPSGVTSIGRGAFYDCDNLRSIAIGTDKVEFISDGNWDNNWERESVFSANNVTLTILSSVSVIKENAFSGWTGLAGVIIENGITEIGDNAFSDCANLAAVTIGNGVKSIGSSAFSGCAITGVTIPDKVTEIGNYAFSKCARLTEINVAAGNGKYYAQDGALYYKNTKQSDGPVGTYLHTYPAGKTDSVFTLPGGVNSFLTGAFQGCAALNTVNITITNAGGNDSTPDSGSNGYGFTDTFSGCANLTAINISGENLFSTDGVVYGDSTGWWDENKMAWQTGRRRTLIICPAGKTGALTIPDGVDEIGGWAFHDCAKLTGVTIPDSVTTIGFGAFVYCSSLTSITIPNSVTSIGQYAFESTGLTTVTIGSGVTRLVDAFYGCTGLTSVTFQGDINDYFYYPDRLYDAYREGGRGTYTRPNNTSDTWTKQQ
jgi:hypothetical protein